MKKGLKYLIAILMLASLATWFLPLISVGTVDFSVMELLKTGLGRYSEAGDTLLIYESVRACVEPWMYGIAVAGGVLLFETMLLVLLSGNLVYAFSVFFTIANHAALAVLAFFLHQNLDAIEKELLVEGVNTSLGLEMRVVFIWLAIYVAVMLLSLIGLLLKSGKNSYEEEYDDYDSYEEDYDEYEDDYEDEYGDEYDDGYEEEYESDYDEEYEYGECYRNRSGSRVSAGERRGYSASGERVRAYRDSYAQRRDYEEDYGYEEKFAHGNRSGERDGYASRYDERADYSNRSAYGESSGYAERNAYVKGNGYEARAPQTGRGSSEKASQAERMSVAPAAEKKTKPRTDYYGVICGDAGVYAGKAYALSDKTEVYILWQEGMAVLTPFEEENALVGIYYIPEQGEYCVEPAIGRTVFLGSGQPLGGGRSYYLPRGVQLYIKDRSNAFTLA